ncbi:MAG: hypothetical protein JXR81_04850 [Candidatus Goldbacteria bacterium]|nr:hypothetical protein [Candidatus Goldiibacteriota bacterium]
MKKFIITVFILLFACIISADEIIKIPRKAMGKNMGRINVESGAGTDSCHLYTQFAADAAGQMYFLDQANDRILKYIKEEDKCEVIHTFHKSDSFRVIRMKFRGFYDNGVYFLRGQQLHFYDTQGERLITFKEISNAFIDSKNGSVYEQKGLKYLPVEKGNKNQMPQRGKYSILPPAGSGEEESKMTAVMGKFIGINNMSLLDEAYINGRYTVYAIQDYVDKGKMKLMKYNLAEGTVEQEKGTGYMVHAYIGDYEGRIYFLGKKDKKSKFQVVCYNGENLDRHGTRSINLDGGDDLCYQNISAGKNVYPAAVCPDGYIYYSAGFDKDYLLIGKMKINN